MSFKAKKNSDGVGYGRPPLHSRFKKGQSGNPTGRRRYTESERGRQLLRQEANRLVTVRDGDKASRITARRAMLRSLFITAIKGNPTAQKTILSVLGDSESADHETNPRPIAISWLEPVFTAPDPASIFDRLELSHLTDEQLAQLKELLAVALKKNLPMSE